MTKTLCLVASCERVKYCKGYCTKHYQRLQRTGTLEIRTDARPDSQQRFWSRVTKTESCWLWRGCKDKNGYGKLGIQGKSLYAHRVAYEWMVGPIPSETPFLDHICHDPGCVKPEHLRPVTQQQNLENRAGARQGSASGHRGVSLHRATGKWVAGVRRNGKMYSAGYFEDVNEAAEAARLLRLALQTHNSIDRL